MSSSFSAAWLRGDHQALELFPDRFRHRGARAEAAAEAGSRQLSRELLAALIEQNARLATSPAREKNLELLSRPGTIVAVTGQQMGLFLGPLFTLYKALSAVAAARALTEETGRPCVPIFWLQTEDHDLPEINHTFVPRSTSGALKVGLDQPDAAASRSPVERQLLGESVVAALAALRAELGTQPHAAEHLGLLERAYRPGATMAQAFAEVAGEVFAADGLVLLNPRDPRIARLSAPVHRRAIAQAEPFARTLAERGRALEAAGYSEQVHIRPGAPLGFFSPDGTDGPRYRLDPDGDERWSLVGHPAQATVTTPELMGWLEREPLRFTTSALLRPLVQDTLLPTAAYIGGPGELAYFAQLAPLYEVMGLPMPLIVPRARFRVLDDRSRGLLDKLAMSADDVEQPLQKLLVTRAAAAGFDTPEAVEARLHQALAPELAKLGARLTELDPGLAQALERTEETIKGALSRLLGKYGRALGQRDQVTLERLERVRSYLCPDGAPQERVFGMAYCACRFGTQAFVSLVRDACVPFSGELEDLRP